MFDRDVNITSNTPLHCQVAISGNVHGGKESVSLISKDTIAKANTWTVISVKIKTKSDVTITHFKPFIYGLADGTKFWVKWWKLEEGNRATDWTPAPEDYDAQFSSINQTINSITTIVQDAQGDISALQQTANSLATRITGAEGNISTLTQTVDGLQTTVTDVQGDVSTLTQTADALQTRMTTAEGNISTLTQTANSLTSQISAKADQSWVSSQISQLSNAINLRVEKDKIINQINISTEGILIDGKKIHITGQTTIDNAVIKDAMIESVSASKISASSLSAISANLGTVTAGTIRGVTVEGITGTFGNVTVRNGDFTIQDDVSGVQYSAILLPNLIKDHSFETVPYDPNSLSTTYRWANAIMPYIGGYANSPWEIAGSPKVTFQLGPDPVTHLPIFGKQAVCVSTNNYFRQFIKVAPNATYTLSAFVKRQANVTAGGTLRLEVWESALLDNKRVRQIAAQTFPAVKSDYTVERRALTFTASLSDPENLIEIVITGGNSYWVQVDGVQLVQADKPSVYNPEDTVFDIVRGDQKILFEHGRLWSGVAYMNANQTIYPEKKITDCPNGWILVWSDYDPGVGANDFNWVFNYIPKGFIWSVFGNGQGVLVPTPHANNTQTNAKYVYVFDDRISGHDDNQASPLNDVCLRYVLEW